MARLVGQDLDKGGSHRQSELYQVRPRCEALPVDRASGPTCSPQEFFPQIAQYTCVYDALHRTVQCKPFVRTFMKQANGLMSEVTPFVNAGHSLPRAGLDVPPEARSERHVLSLLLATLLSWR